MLPAHKKRKNVRPFPSSLDIKSRALWSVKNFLINSSIFHRKIKSSQRANEEPLVVHRRTTPPSFFWSGMLTILLRWSQNQRPKKTSSVNGFDGKRKRKQMRFHRWWVKHLYSVRSAGRWQQRSWARYLRSVCSKEKAAGGDNINVSAYISGENSIWCFTRTVNSKERTELFKFVQCQCESCSQ